MALLINFSKPIAIFIFDGAQLLMNYFLAANVGYDTTVARLSNIANILYNSIPGFMNRWVTWKSDGSVITLQIFVIVFQFMYFIALIVLGIFLLIRIIAMWLIIIVSPFAFLAETVPDFKKMSSDWWNALFKYSLIGPAIGFFLYISTFLASSKMESIARQFDRGESIVSLPNFIAYAVIIVFLYASIIMAQKFSIVGAAAITNRANKIMKGAAKSSYKVPRWASRRTGATGAVSQRLQQSKWLRTLTKAGRDEIQEEREAAIAERIGVTGAKERLMKRRAKKLEDEGYSVEAKEKMVINNKDLAAAYSLAGEGKLNSKAYEVIKSSIKGKDAKRLNELLDKKVMEKRVDVIIKYKQKGAANATEEFNIAREELGKLDPSKWRNQEIKEIVKDMPTASAARDLFLSMHHKNKDKVIDDMAAGKYADGAAAGLW